MNALVGYTGFVGSNLYAEGKFDGVYNSKNIKKAYGTNPDLLVYAGLRAEKYLANNNPEEDMKLIWDAEDNIRRINPKKLVLISTIDVFKMPLGVDENSFIDIKGLHAYGYNRYQLELWVRENFPDALIVRLPALFGKNIRKNFIYDYINVIPFMLKDSKFDELTAKEPVLKKYYFPLDNGFYKADIPKEKRGWLKTIFHQLGFSALNFTDCRSKYQFYNLKRLWHDIQIAFDANLTLWHPATEPISAGDLYEYLCGKSFINILDGEPANYDYRTIHGKLFNDNEKYIDKAENIMREIKQFVEGRIN